MSAVWKAREVPQNTIRFSSFRHGMNLYLCEQSLSTDISTWPSCKLMLHPPSRPTWDVYQCRASKIQIFHPTSLDSSH
jgi:hypothetical protein